MTQGEGRNTAHRRSSIAHDAQAKSAQRESAEKGLRHVRACDGVASEMGQSLGPSALLFGALSEKCPRCLPQKQLRGRAAVADGAYVRQASPPSNDAGFSLWPRLDEEYRSRFVRLVLASA